MKRVIWIVFLLLFLWVPETIWAEDMESMIDALHLEEVDREIDQEQTGGITFRSLVEKAVSQKEFLSPANIASGVMELLFGELKGQLYLVKQMIIIVLLSAVLKNLNASFQGKSVGELGFYVCYMVLIVLITRTFYDQTKMVGETVQHMADSFQAMLPAFFALAASSGSYAQTAVIGPVIMGGAGLLTTFLSAVVLPIITLAASLEMISHITEKPMLGRFTDLVKSGVSWGMKGIAIVFMTLLSVQKLGTSSVNQVVGKTAKAAVGAIPVIGDVMDGAVEAAAALTGTLRHGTLAAAIVFLVILCAIPLIKLGVMVLIYKLAAAVSEPICEGRLVKCISAAGDFSGLLFGVLFLAEVMFIFSAVILLTVL